MIMNAHSLLRCLAALIVPLALLCGCSPWSTYPPVETKPARSLTRPTYEPVPTVIALALEYTRENYLPGQSLPINLPDGNWELYDRVFQKLGDEAQPMKTVGEPAIHIKEVRTRDVKAQVDVIFTRPDGLNQLLTLSMQRELFSDWKVTGARVWQIRDIEVPDPTYNPPTSWELLDKNREAGPGGERPDQPATMPERPATRAGDR